MPKDIKTNVVIEHQTKGFDKVRRNSDQLTGTLRKIKGSLGSLRKEYRETTKALQDLIKTQGQQTKQAEESQRKMARSGAFTQGLLQGAAPGAAPLFLQRGPGMARQAAGMAIGNMGRAGVGGSFTGVQGLQQFLGSIPGVGGLLAGQVGRLAGYAEQNINYQRTKLAVSPYLSTFGELEQAGRARRTLGGIRERIGELGGKPEKEAYTDITKTFVTKQAKVAKAAVQPAKAMAEIGPIGILKSLFTKGVGETIKDVAKTVATSMAQSQKDMAAAVVEAKEQYQTIATKLVEEGKVNDKRLGHLKKMEKIAKAAVQATSPNLGIAGAGLRFAGMNQEEALRLYGGFMEAGGGVATAQQAREMTPSVFAAKTMYGIQAQTAGAFLRGGRRGGLVGGTDQANEQFKTAINEGIALGLSGSEINQWMQQIAQGINQFQQTGIPINVGSISKLATDIGKSGLEATRAITMAQGISRYTQGIGGKGVQSGVDLMLLQSLGGYKGGGVEEYRAARARLEKMQFEAQGAGVGGIAGSPIGEALGGILGRVGGGQGTKAEMLQRILQRMGVQGGVEEFNRLAATLTGGQISPEQKAAMERFKEGQAAGATELAAIAGRGGLTGAAAYTVAQRAPNLQRMAAIQNQQITVGGKFVKTLQTLETNAINVSVGFQKLAGGPLQDLSTAMGELSQAALETAENVKSWFSGSGLGALL